MVVELAEHAKLKAIALHCLRARTRRYSQIKASH